MTLSCVPGVSRRVTKKRIKQKNNKRQPTYVETAVGRVGVRPPANAAERAPVEMLVIASWMANEHQAPVFVRATWAWTTTTTTTAAMTDTDAFRIRIRRFKKMYVCQIDILRSCRLGNNVDCCIRSRVRRVKIVPRRTARREESRVPDAAEDPNLHVGYTKLFNDHRVD